MKKLIALFVLVLFTSFSLASADCGCAKKRKGKAAEVVTASETDVHPEQDSVEPPEGRSEQKKAKTNEFITCHKVYVQPEQVSIGNSEILVAINHTIVKTSALHSDQKGVYFKDFRQDDCPDGTWYCTDCTGCHENWYVRCPILN